jgi:hypothetical protein
MAANATAMDARKSRRRQLSPAKSSIKSRPTSGPRRMKHDSHVSVPADLVAMKHPQKQEKRNPAGVALQRADQNQMVH